MKKIIGTLTIIMVVTLGLQILLSTDVEANVFNKSANGEEIPKLDIVFVIDTTGSMSDEIREVKMHIKNIIKEISEGEPRPDIKIGFVAYRDYPDEERGYVYKKFMLNDDIESVIEFLDNLQATGGGDYPETVTVGLDIAINEMEWRESEEKTILEYNQNQQSYTYNTTDIRRMIFLIGDAKPRTKPYNQGQGETITPISYEKNIEDAQNMGIFIYTISGSGMCSTGIEIWKEIASQTNAAYERLVYEEVSYEEYKEEHEIEDKWDEEIKRSSDYDSTEGTFKTNQLGGFVQDNIQYQAECAGVKYKEPVKEEPVLIKAPCFDQHQFRLDNEKYVKTKILCVNQFFLFL